MRLLLRLESERKSCAIWYILFCQSPKMEECKAKEAERGGKPRGKKPKEPKPRSLSDLENRSPRPKEQVNPTGQNLRIIPKSGGSFVQGYNGQARVDMETMLIAGRHVTRNTIDKQEVELALVELG
ncbi:MAG: hypothetical protein BECKG1743D_GA0114223_103333 [Candidatus Kentron sp. G]|nr:MAG: hypothetical protein BECKG1743F_GA0114225_103192 [Candidatus Kentron sp. G]VFN02066.1 MAG: hypothetical protein BECKG1743D_GA0114223_103333 [Candidatus Kentron sp. G]VFN04874.1 MAG: hypothetical protein BECKG1743E_GA0114224_107883 [Candidatus Kentron sp. G]